MADKFVRQKSNRWVKADKPTYGDWGDDDDDDDDEEEEDCNANYNNYDENYRGNNDSNSIRDNLNQSYSTQNNDTHQPVEHFQNSSNNADTRGDSNNVQNDLVLSIDQRKNINYDTSDDDEDKERSPSILKEGDTPEAESIKSQPSKSIQVLNLAHSHTQNSFDLQPPTPTYNSHQRQRSVSSADPQTPLSESSFQSDSSIQHEPEYLSIKNTIPYIPKEESDNVHSPIEAHEQQNSNLILSIDDNREKDDDSSENDEWNDASNTKSEPDIDSFLTDLNTKLPSIDHDSTLSDFENSSFSKYHDEKQETDNDEIAPLSIQRENHNKYVNSIASRKSSVRKPPTTKADSGDYSNIVSGYEDDENEDNEIGGIEDMKPDENESNDAKESNIGTNDLHPVASTGSLSTGNFSIETNRTQTYSKPTIPNEDDSRRVSQSTINFGNWKPDTDIYRNQFINQNDDVSTINFDPSKTYDSFTNAQESIEDDNSEQISNSSSLSVPETIEATMPSIEEDYSDQDEENDHKSLNHTLNTGYSSLLNDNSYSKPVFHEEKLTPAASKENLQHDKSNMQNQRYSSLLSPSEKAENLNSNSKSEADQVSTPPKTNRNVSSTTITTGDFKPQKYPVSHWKKIMSISQPIDRIEAYRDALFKEMEYDTGLQNWLLHTLKQTESNQNQIHIGRIASAAYQNAPHNDLRRHASLRSKVNIVKDKVEGTGSTASQFGKKLFSRSKKFIRSEK
ncbi:unnamed protein product [Candida verbasci]|uniref:Protein FYV8 n=1 Tax=Candida verbasci TaxID=1227364 RepID=A0A9W4TYK5_9ASCO|nr:unnamed protein product [Candida verbasci]